MSRSFPGIPADTGLVPGRVPRQGAAGLGQGPEETWVHGSLRVQDGIAVTITASRSSSCYQQFFATVEAADPGTGEIAVITGNLSGHNSCATRD